MIVQAAATTSALVALCVFARLLHDERHAESPAHALVQQALHWREVAAQDGDAALRLQHATTAATLLQAARAVAQDDALERASGMDVPKLARALDADMADARAALAGGNADQTARSM